MAKLKAFNTGMFAEKVIALSTYDSTVLTQLYQSPDNRRKISRGAAYIVKNYFDQYMDSKARSLPEQFHHIYEFNRPGDKNSRLFKAAVIDAPAGATIRYSFTQARVPNNFGYEFANKAQVMESGETVVVKPKRGQYLKYKLDGGQFVTTKESVIRNPGGPVAGNFTQEFNRFMAVQAARMLEKFKYYQMIERAMIGKRRLVIPRINSGMVADAARRAKIDADQIANVAGIRNV